MMVRKVELIADSMAWQTRGGAFLWEPRPGGLMLYLPQDRGQYAEAGERTATELVKLGYDLRGRPSGRFNHVAVIGRNRAPPRDGIVGRSTYGVIMGDYYTSTLVTDSGSLPQLAEATLKAYLKAYPRKNLVLTYPQAKTTVIRKLNDLGCVVEVLEKSRDSEKSRKRR